MKSMSCNCRPAVVAGILAVAALLAAPPGAVAQTSCPLAEPLCDAHLDQCTTGAPDDLCYAFQVYFDDTLNPQAESCNCSPQGVCGPVFVEPGIGVRCPGNCPDPTLPCNVFVTDSTGVTTSLGKDNAQIGTDFQPFDLLECRCDDTPPDKYCIYEVTCTHEEFPGACDNCPAACEPLCHGSLCPNDTCASGTITTTCNDGCCIEYTWMGECRELMGEPACPTFGQSCTCSEELGACCADDGTCTQATSCDCVGKWFGPGTDCGPVGGCCLGDGTCVPGMNQLCCEDMGGTFSTQDCTGITGKCCDAAGGCVDGVDESCCDGAFFAGATCTGPQECCLGEACIEVDPDCCLAMGGTPGPGVCDPPVKCCFQDGTCSDIEPDCCELLGGTAGNGPCQEQGCCLPNGTCTDLDPECCQRIGGSPLTGLCQPPQACCFGDGTCQLLEPRCCLDQGGTPHAGNCQPVQACCFGDDSCAMLEPRCCQDSGGTPEGAGSSCDPTGSCCEDTDGDGIVDSCSVMSFECCVDNGGRFHAGADCTNVGACCYDLNGDGVNDGCEDITQECCADIPGSTFKGVGTSCATPGICDDTPPDVCLLANQWCANNLLDCQGGLANDLCWPRLVTVGPNLQPVVNRCACFGEDCGPIDIIPTATGDNIFSCINQCPDPTQNCVIHLNGTATDLFQIRASQVQPGSEVTCDCTDPPPDPCPTELGSPNDPCWYRQDVDCQDAQDGELCLPRTATFTNNGVPIATWCDCQTRDECGPVTIDGDLVSCIEQCPPGTPGICVVHENGISTGKTVVNIGDVSVGSRLTCECEEVSLDCEPQLDGTGCTDVICPIPTEDCQERCVSYDPNTGEVITTDCDCMELTRCRIRRHGIIIAVPGDPLDPTLPDYPGGVIGQPWDTINDRPATASSDQRTVQTEILSMDLTGVAPIQVGDVSGHQVQGDVRVRMTFGPNDALVVRELQMVVEGTLAMPAMTPDAEQSHPQEVLDLQGAIFGDPDFDELHLTAGTRAGLSNTGQVDLFRRNDQLWNVDSFFDIEYRIDFQGAPGSIIEGRGGTAFGNVDLLLGKKPVCKGKCPPGTKCVERVTVNADGTRTVCCDCIDEPVCGPTDDRKACNKVKCPGKGEKCVPRAVIYNPLTNEFEIRYCDCGNPKRCHVELDPASDFPFCVGECPDGTVCELFSKDTDSDGIDDVYRCRCIPIQQECGPTDDKTDCNDVVCPIATDRCIPQTIAWQQGTPAEVIDCDCQNPERCHVEFDDAVGPFCQGICPPGETCRLFGKDTDGDGVEDRWKCECVPVELECGPDPTAQACNPVACPDPAEICIPQLIEVDWLTGNVRVVECECQSPNECHVEYDAATSEPFCTGACPPGRICKLFGDDINGDGLNDRYRCDCVEDDVDCRPNAARDGCDPFDCPDPNQTCEPTLTAVDILTGQEIVLECDCVTIDPPECHWENVGGAFACVGLCPDGTDCQVTTTADGSLNCGCDPTTQDCAPDTLDRTKCADVVCPNPQQICRPKTLKFDSNGNIVVDECECIDPQSQCHVELNTKNEPFCTGICPPGETCTLISADLDGDGIDDAFKCDCLPPATECEPNDTQQGCLPTVCPDPTEVCEPRVVSWLPGTPPMVDECECVGDNECHVEIDPDIGSPFCVGVCPDGTDCRLFSADDDNDGIAERWWCDCVPVQGQCSPTDDGQACKPTVCPDPNEICLPRVISVNADGTIRVDDCDCVNPDLECHIEAGPNNQPICVGQCPDGQVCELFGLDTNGDGIRDRFTCDCVDEGPVCEPNAEGTECTNVICPLPNQRCVPTTLTCDPNFSDCRVTDCECQDVEACRPVLNPPGVSPPYFCEGACPIGTKCIRSKADLDGDGVAETFGCDCVNIPPPPTVVPGEIAKSRTLVFNPGGGGQNVAGLTDTAFRVRMVELLAPLNPPVPNQPDFSAFEGEVRWVGPVDEYREGQAPTPTFFGSLVQCDAYFADWSGVSSLAVGGAEVLPQSTYIIQSVDSSCPDLEDENCYSDPLILVTGRFGDLVAPFEGSGFKQPDILDILEVVNKLLGATPPTQASADMGPNVLDFSLQVNIRDVLDVVDQFLGAPYPYHGPCPCPSEVTCDPGDDSVVDECGRCTE